MPATSSILHDPRVFEKARCVYLALLGLSAVALLAIALAALAVLSAGLMLGASALVYCSSSIAQTWSIADPLTRVIMLALACLAIRQIVIWSRNHAR